MIPFLVKNQSFSFLFLNFALFCFVFESFALLCFVLVAERCRPFHLDCLALRKVLCHPALELIVELRGAGPAGADTVSARLQRVAHDGTLPAPTVCLMCCPVIKLVPALAAGRAAILGHLGSLLGRPDGAPVRIVVEDVNVDRVHGLFISRGLAQSVGEATHLQSLTGQCSAHYQDIGRRVAQTQPKLYHELHVVVVVLLHVNGVHDLLVWRHIGGANLFPTQLVEERHNADLIHLLRGELLNHSSLLFFRQ